jgi:hypothetical protein
VGSTVAQRENNGEVWHSNGSGGLPREMTEWVTGGISVLKIKFYPQAPPPSAHIWLFWRNKKTSSFIFGRNIAPVKIVP